MVDALNVGHPSEACHSISDCFHKGPNGSPTYDKSGLELDYEKVANWMKPKPYNKRAIMRGMDRAVEKSTIGG